jgi:hypothetical protein
MADNPILFPKWQPQLTAMNETDPAKLLERVREMAVPPDGGLLV